MLSPDESQLPSWWRLVQRDSDEDWGLIDELMNEVGNPHPLWSTCRNGTIHVVARCRGTDDVLYEVQGPRDHQPRLALVHLTWRGLPDLPDVQFFSNIEDWLAYERSLADG